MGIDLWFPKEKSDLWQIKYQKLKQINKQIKNCQNKVAVVTESSLSEI